MKLSNLLIVTGLAALGVMLFASPQPRRRYRFAGGAGDAAATAPDGLSAEASTAADWDPVDEASAESFPASDPPAR